MPTFKISGKISKISEVAQVSPNYQKQEVWLDVVEGQYEINLTFDFGSKMFNRLAEFSAGENVEITFAAHGREHNDKRFVSLKGININPTPSGN